MLGRLWRTVRSWPRWAQGVTLLIVLVIVIAAAASGGNKNKTSTTAEKSQATTTSTTTSTPTATQTPMQAPATSDAQRLAAYQEGVSSVAAADPLAAKIDTALNRLEPDCKESRDRVAGEVWASWKDLHKNGLSDSILSVLTHVRRSIPSSMAPTNCAQIMAAYLVLREG